MKDLGRAHHLLGCEVNHDESSGETYLSHYQITKTAVEKFLPEDSGIMDTPCGPSVNLYKSICPQSSKKRGENLCVSRILNYIYICVNGLWITVRYYDYMK